LTFIIELRTVARLGLQFWYGYGEELKVRGYSEGLVRVRVELELGKSRVRLRLGLGLN